MGSLPVKIPGKPRPNGRDQTAIGSSNDGIERLSVFLGLKSLIRK
jgi:hypothetical protein